MTIYARQAPQNVLVSAKKQLQLVLTQICYGLRGMGTQSRQLTNCMTHHTVCVLLRIKTSTGIAQLHLHGHCYSV